MLTGQTAKLSTKNKLHYGYVYVIYKPRLLGVFDIYTTRVRGQRKYATDKP